MAKSNIAGRQQPRARTHARTHATFIVDCLVPWIAYMSPAATRGLVVRITLTTVAGMSICGVGPTTVNSYWSADALHSACGFGPYEFVNCRVMHLPAVLSIRLPV